MTVTSKATDSPISINLHDGYAKVRYRRLISNDYCNEEFEVEVPAPVDSVFAVLQDLEAEGVEFAKRALTRHSQYKEDKRKILYGYPDPDEEDEDL